MNPLNCLSTEINPFHQEVINSYLNTTILNNATSIKANTCMELSHPDDLTQNVTRVYASLEVDLDLKAILICQVINISNFIEALIFDMLIDCINNVTCNGIVRNLSNNNLITVQVTLARDCKSLSTCITKVIQVRLSGVQDTTGTKLWSSQNIHQFMTIFNATIQNTLCTLTNVFQCKRRNIAAHCNSNTTGCINQNSRELNRQQLWLRCTIIIRRQHIYCIFINTVKHLITNCCKLRLSITRCCGSDIVRVNLTKVTLTINVRYIQRLIALSQSNQCIINCTITMRMKVHRGSNDICTLSTIPIQKLHLIHRIQYSTLNRL